MILRFKILQIVGVALVAFGLSAGFYFNFEEIRLPGHIPAHTWFSLIFLGQFCRSAGEAGALRLRHKDKAETLSNKEAFGSLAVGAVLTAVVVWFAK